MCVDGGTANGKEKAMTGRWLAIMLMAGQLAFGAFLGTPAPAVAQGFPKSVSIAAGERAGERILRVGLGRSVVVDVAEDVADVLVSEPEIANATVRSRNRIYVVGNRAGQASVVLFGTTGREIASFSVRVEPDTSDLNAIIRKLMPNTDIRADSLNGSVVLSGTAPSTADAQKAADLASRFLGQGNGEGGSSSSQPVLNMISVGGKDQIQLKVTVAEVDRSVIKQLGVTMSGTLSSGSFGLGIANAASFPVNTGITSQGSLLGSFSSGGNSFAAQIRALQRDGVIRTLAEPTLTAISGENASFIAGGEFPIPVSYDNDKLGVEFKQFGVGLDFTPVVLNEGNVSLRIKTEVSELSDEGAVTTGGITIPAIKVRRAESTVELPSGGTLVMAGLLKESYRQTVSGVPGLMQLPVLGALFKSRDFLRQQTEMVVFVTPYVVKPVAQSALARPDSNFAPPSDGETIFFNQLNRVFNTAGAPVPGSYQGQVGFIYE